MSKYDNLKLENQLCFSVYATSRAITKLYRPLLRKLGITYTQYLVLMVLWEVNEISLRELSHRLYLDSGTLTPMLKRMEQLGLLTRARAKDDERVLNVTITEQGLKLQDEAVDVYDCILADLHTDPEYLVRIKDDVDQLLNNINDNN
jgi:DNA-binding MarR family transcriptional regulator